MACALFGSCSGRAGIASVRVPVDVAIAIACTSPPIRPFGHYLPFDLRFPPCVRLRVRPGCEAGGVAGGGLVDRVRCTRSFTGDLRETPPA